jgi:hypothetical protein
MVMLNKQVEGTKTEGFSPGDIGRALENQLRILFCTKDKQYAELRTEMKKTRHAVREIGVAIATAIAASWHLQAGLLTPFVLVFLLGIIQVGVGAWCAGKPIEASK